MSGKFILAHDLGTSGNKASLFTTDGKLLKSVTVIYTTDFFNSNWVEQNPEDWWEAICNSTRELLKDFDKNSVSAVSFSGHMMGCVCIDKQGRPLRNGIIWADMRATFEEEQLLRKIPMERVYHITGHRLSSSYSLAKLLWVKNNEPEVFRNTHKMLNAKDYIVYKMTGRLVTDPSDASGTNAFDLNKFCWSDEIIEAAEIDHDIFPEVVPSTFVAGEIGAEVANACGLAIGTPVVVGGGDGMCASVGAGSITVGSTYNCLGSSSWICTTTREPIFDDRLRTFNWAHIVPGLIAPCGTMQTAGAAFSWAKDIICSSLGFDPHAEQEIPYEAINRAIESSVPGANGLLFLPYLLGERSPLWNPDAKGAFIGLKMEHRKADLVRSVVEGIGMNLNTILKIFREHIAIDEMFIIGGMAQGDMVRSILADIFNVRITPLKNLEEATSMGAAVTAGVGVGLVDGFGAIHRFIEINGQQIPHPENTAYYRRLQPVFDEAYESLTNVFGQLSRL